MSVAFTSEFARAAIGASSRTPGSLAGLDGALAHRSVPMENWCVTKKDLLYLQKQVQQHVASGLIHPTALDPFDPSDHEVGPCIHTVNSQFIKPVTERAGNYSWALMCHPEGGKCDLFVTHAWQEGIYEFITKVLNSWPSGAQYAYCCMLSNPQNLDIGDLIASPAHSPFAQALHSAKWMMVVPNRKGSIYCRIWCTYEAFLAYTWEKDIFTASLPIRHVWWRVLVPLVILVAIRCSVTAPPTNGMEIVFYCVPVSLLLRPFLVARFANYVGALHSVLQMDLRWGQWPSLQNGNIVPILLFIFFAVADAECVRSLHIQAESIELQNGYTGHVTKAQSSSEQDRVSIMAEILGKEREVDFAVDVLIRSGMSTPSLRAASRAGVDVRSAADPKYSVFLVVNMFFAYGFLLHGFAFSVSNTIEGIAFAFPMCVIVSVYTISTREDRAFIASSSGRLSIITGFIHFSAFGLAAFNTCFDIWLFYYMTMLQIFLCSALGLRGVARVPVVGPLIVNLLMSNSISAIAASICPCELFGRWCKQLCMYCRKVSSEQTMETPASVELTSQS